MSLFTLTIQKVILDGYKNFNTSEAVPTVEIMKENFPEVEGFIVPFSTNTEVLAWIELARKLEKPIVGWRVVPAATKDPRVSVQQAVSFLKSKNFLMKDHVVFIDARKPMREDCVKSQRFVIEMYDELQMHLGSPERIGVLTKRATWMEDFCNYAKWGHVKLWYVNQNEKQQFGDFTNFGAWKAPWAKQFLQKTVMAKGEQKVAVSMTFM